MELARAHPTSTSRVVLVTDAPPTVPPVYQTSSALVVSRIKWLWKVCVRAEIISS